MTTPQVASANKLAAQCKNLKHKEYEKNQVLKHLNALLQNPHWNQRKYPLCSTLKQNLAQ